MRTIVGCKRRERRIAMSCSVGPTYRDSGSSCSFTICHEVARAVIRRHEYLACERASSMLAPEPTVRRKRAASRARRSTARALLSRARRRTSPFTTPPRLALTFQNPPDQAFHGSHARRRSQRAATRPVTTRARQASSLRCSLSTRACRSYSSMARSWRWRQGERRFIVDKDKDEETQEISRPSSLEARRSSAA